jgi:hypothetical protein
MITQSVVAQDGASVTESGLSPDSGHLSFPICARRLRGLSEETISLGISAKNSSMSTRRFGSSCRSHAGLNCLSPLAWGNDEQTALPNSPRPGQKARHVRAHGVGPWERRAWTADGRCETRRALLPYRREDVDLASRRRRQFLDLCVDGSREDTDARHVGLRPFIVERTSRGFSSGTLYEGTREIHNVMQADYVLGYRTDQPTRCDLPPYVKSLGVGQT